MDVYTSLPREVRMEVNGEWEDVRMIEEIGGKVVDFVDENGHRLIPVRVLRSSRTFIGGNVLGKMVVWRLVR